MLQNKQIKNKKSNCLGLSTTKRPPYIFGNIENYIYKKEQRKKNSTWTLNSTHSRVLRHRTSMYKKQKSNERKKDKINNENINEEKNICRTKHD